LHREESFFRNGKGSEGEELKALPVTYITNKTLQAANGVESPAAIIPRAGTEGSFSFTTPPSGTSW